MIAKCDAHHHLWRYPDPHWPALLAEPSERFYGHTGPLKKSFEVAEFAALARAQNVTHSVYVETHFTPAIEETAYFDAVADVHGFPNAIIGSVDLAAPDLDAQLDVHQRSKRFRGVRVSVNWDADPRFRSAPREGILRDPAWRRGYARMGERGLSVEVMAMPAQLGKLAGLAKAHPGTPLILGHCGLPARRTAAEDRIWRDGIAILAALPNVALKISGLGMLDHKWTTESIAPLVLHLIDLFGADRCMFGSNFPVDGLHASYDRIWNAFDEITAGLPSADRDALFSGTAKRIYAIS